MTLEYHGAYSPTLPDYATHLYGRYNEEGRLANLHKVNDNHFVVEAWWEDVGVCEYWTTETEEEARQWITELCGEDADWIEVEEGV